MNKKELKNSILFITMIIIGLAVGTSCKKDTPKSDTDLLLIENYAIENNLDGEFTDSGLYYVINEPGGANHPTLSSNVTVTYDGYNLSGEPIDDGSFITFKLSQLI